jgi:hypothetical protein
LFVPEDLKRWPAIDSRDPTYQRDLASLQVRGGDPPMSGMDHGHGTEGSTSDPHAHESH